MQVSDFFCVFVIFWLVGGWLVYYFILVLLGYCVSHMVIVVIQIALLAFMADCTMGILNFYYFLGKIGSLPWNT